MITVVIPAFNEEGAIGPAVERVRALPQFANPEVIVVDDGSSDRTAETAATAGARVLRHPHNLGYGRALKAGILAASNDTIVIIDADGTYAAEDIPRLVDAYGRGFDMVVGVRSDVRRNESAFKTLLRWLLTALVEFTAGRRIPDVNSGLRVFNRRTIEPYFGQLCDTFSFTTSLTLAYMMTGRFVTFAPISYGKRHGQSKVKLFRDALRTLQYIVQSILYYNPIKLFLLASAFAALFTVLLALVAIAVTTATTALIVLAIGSAAAMLLFGLGLVADLLRQIMKK
jgi:glycosyltransferase involved in cell wall biosynthesis